MKRVTQADWIRRTSINSDLVGVYSWQTKHTTRISAGRLLFFVGLNAYFILPFLFPTDIYSAVPDTWRYYIVSYLFILIGATLEIRRQQLRIQPALKTWISLFAGILAWMLLRSLIVGESPLSALLNGMVYLSLLLMAILGQSTKTWKSLNSLFIVHTLMGGLYTLYTLFASGVTQRTDLMIMSGHNILSGSGTNMPAALYAVPFLVYSFPMQSRLGKLATVVGYAAMLLYFIFWQSRIGSVLLIVQLLILVLVLWRGKHLHLFRLGSVAITLLVVALLFVVLVNGSRWSDDLGDRLSRAVSLLSDRWLVGGSTLGTVQEDYRMYEARIFVQQLSWDEWLAGRGVAATWQDPRVYAGAVRTMVHIGYLHYILNGGILLLLLMLAPLVFGIRALLKGRDLLTIAAGALWVQYSIVLLGYGFPSASLTWVLMGLALGKSVVFNGEPTQSQLADLQRADPST